MLKRLTLIFACVFLIGGALHAQTDAAHPHLWITAQDLPRLQAWAAQNNPLYTDGLWVLANEAAEWMDEGIIPAQDTGSNAYEEYPTESYALLFAFMSLIESNETARQEYAQRSRDLLMYVMDQAVLGVADDQPFRHTEFATSDRSRWYGVSFPLIVDWIYPTLSAEDKATIRTVFLRWCAENLNAYTTNNNHPEPIGVVNDPVLVSDPSLVRWAGNNYYVAHMRNMGLMALAFDAADDPGGELGAYLENATGAWLYVIDHLFRTDARGGFGTEGFEYSPQSLGYAAQFMLALQTSGANDPTVWGQQVSFEANPFWNDAIAAFVHSMSPATAVSDDAGVVYLPAWYGSGQNYWLPDYIELFGSLGAYDVFTGANPERLDALRWLQSFTPPGGEFGLVERVQDVDSVHKAILYFLLFDPNAAAPADPRPTYGTSWYAPGMRRLLARTDWSENAAWFTYNLSWDEVDHQSGNGNAIEFYRAGEWLTKIRVGYDFDYHTSDNFNTLTVQNTLPDRDDFRLMIGQRGSQWLLSAGDPPPPLISVTDDYVYAFGDSTALYNSEYEGVTAVEHVSRSVIWLKPDVIVVYDRSATRAENPVSRFWLNFPADATVSGSVTSMTTERGQTLTVDTLLPADPVIAVSPLVDEVSSAPANNEMMRYRLMVEAAAPEVRFLHVLQGADAGAVPLTSTLIESNGGTAFQGALVGTVAVLFPVDALAAFESLDFSTTAATSYITGLTPNAGYAVTINGDAIQIAPGTQLTADAGGVLVVRR
ncbi:MAG: hypothetical protein IPK17_30260 [Chloroflexi bacterium]|uniref:hypothetical protein n=1 Tax=Candidatus Flexifilum breve TaxID=3140694 RepID=UPI003135F3DD|nr:hypothetical protein [Chloroflexota bacterium]